MITIGKTSCNFEREPLRVPVGFKGHALTELWQTVAGMTDTAGRRAVGVGTQSALWSDATIFTRFGEAAANGLMFQLTAQALRLCEGRSFTTPDELFDELLPEVLAYGRHISSNPALRPTFALNSLVPVDLAAWQLYAAVHECPSFNDLLEKTGATRPPSPRLRQLGSIPLISYGVPPGDAAALAAEGHPILKIKIGSDPSKDGDLDKMLEWDCARMAQLHVVLREYATPHTANGKIAYYLDANGRYDSIDRIKQLLEFCDRIGALPQILLLEEPFPEGMEADVRGLPVRVAADESAHSVEDCAARVDAGYGAIALKPVAKTLSLSLRMAAFAATRDVPCFCADLTANPVLVEWGKNVAAGLTPLPGMVIGVLESNGAQYYRDWDRLKSYHSAFPAPWIDPHRGVFNLNERFFATAGGALQPNLHYGALLSN